jgi:GT2 family glycosyltransferase
MDPQPSAPPVVAVVVTCDPGPWLEEALAAVAAQEYPNLSVLVIDAASDEDPTVRVASVMPNAYVRRLPDRVGFSRAANEVLSIVEGASHYLFCHDDVAPEPDTIRVLVEARGGQSWLPSSRPKDRGPADRISVPIESRTIVPRTP